MDLSRSNDHRRLIGGTALLTAPLVLLLADGLQMTAGLDPVWPLVAAVGFVFFLPAVLALAHLLRRGADGLGLLGAGLCVVGLMAGSAMMLLFRLAAVARAGVEGVPTDAVDVVFQSSPLLFASVFPPGPLFPLGMVVLGVGLLRARVAPVWVGVLVALGGVLFPLGRIGGLPVSFLAGDLAWVAALGWLGRQVLTQPRAQWAEATGYRAGRAAMVGA